MAKSNDQLNCTVDRFENGHAVLDFGAYGTISVAKRHLPSAVKEGDVLQVELLTHQIAARRQENIARAILEEILNGQ